MVVTVVGKKQTMNTKTMAAHTRMALRTLSGLPICRCFRKLEIRTEQKSSMASGKTNSSTVRIRCMLTRMMMAREASLSTSEDPFTPGWVQSFKLFSLTLNLRCEGSSDQKSSSAVCTVDGHHGHQSDAGRAVGKHEEEVDSAQPVSKHPVTPEQGIDPQRETDQSEEVGDDQVEEKQVVGVPGLQLETEDPQGHYITQQPQYDINGSGPDSSQMFRLSGSNYELKRRGRWPSKPSLLDLEDLEEMERLRKEHIEALRDIKRLQEQLMESQRVHHQMEEELSKVKQEVRLRAEDSRALRTRIQLAEAAQKQARGMEMDYEEVIHLLEAEIAELKTQRAEQPPSTNQEETDELKKKVSVLECQLRKSEASKKSSELSTGKLLSFVENVQDFLLQSHGPTKSCSSGDVKVGASPQGLPPRHQRSPWTAATLAQEATELTRTVRAIQEVDCLPYGWEEAYTADGDKYYINHMTQTTSWSLPAASGSSEGPPTPPQASEREAEPDGETTEQRPSPSIETEM
ncbi:uncharacterized protein stxbp4 [Platichthys flesus]|uniref:uncharacterized protein stxbp4 n=1 Tax=Platichthys flesus TaxID=8260 RepID=UPI002DB67E9B|nr:uncharacterized protein stxbp4 [Platichthys flesus]